jgi:heme exporter protein D
MALFFDMGKYAAFVWPAYGVSVLGIVSAIVLTMRAYRRAKARLQSFEQSAK